MLSLVLCLLLTTNKLRVCDTLQRHHLLRLNINKKIIMNNISCKNIKRSVTVQIHVETPPISLIKNNFDLKMDRYHVRIKLRRKPMQEKSYMYEFKMDLFHIVDIKEFPLLV